MKILHLHYFMLDLYKHKNYFYMLRVRGDEKIILTEIN